MYQSKKMKITFKDIIIMASIEERLIIPAFFTIDLIRI
jgi:hypothetical protein